MREALAAEEKAYLTEHEKDEDNFFADSKSSLGVISGLLSISQPDTRPSTPSDASPIALNYIDDDQVKRWKEFGTVSLAEILNTVIAKLDLVQSNMCFTSSLPLAKINLAPFIDFI